MAEMKCPKCGREFGEKVKFCPICKTALVEKPPTPKSSQKSLPAPKPSQKSLPGTLWLLPIFFGIIGGIIAALIADMKYQASWLGLLLTGILISIVPILILLALLGL